MHRYNLFGTPAKSRGFQMSKIDLPMPVHREVFLYKKKASPFEG